MILYGPKKDGDGGFQKTYDPADPGRRSRERLLG
jgi:hypothetical protein